MQTYEIVLQTLDAYTKQYNTDSFTIEVRSETEAANIAETYNVQYTQDDPEDPDYGKIVRFTNVNIWRIS